MNKTSVILPYTVNGMVMVFYCEVRDSTEALRTVFYPTIGEALLEMKTFLNSETKL